MRMSSLTLPAGFLGCLVVYLPLHCTALTVIFSICPKCFGERDRKWIQYLLPRQKSILTRTNAFFIPLQLRAGLVFMVLFLVQPMCWVSFAKRQAQGETGAEPSSLLQKANSSFWTFCLSISWETCCQWNPLLMSSASWSRSVVVWKAVWI